MGAMSQVNLRLSFGELENLYLQSGLKQIRAVHRIVLGIGRPGVNLLAKVRKLNLHPRLRWHTGLRMLQGWYDHNLIEVYKQRIERGMTVLDLGANIGYHTRVFSELVGPTGRVYAFEPERECFELLTQNVQAFKYQNVVVICKAVSDSIGRAEFFKTAEAGTHSLYWIKPSETLERTIVDTVTIDAFLEEEGNPNVDFVKMDIEGAEPRALDGAMKTLSRSTGLSMIIEFCPEYLRGLGLDPQVVLCDITNIFSECHVITQDGSLTGADMEQIEKCMVGSRTRHVDLLCQK